VFHGLRAPPISIEAYVERLAKYTKCSPICFVFALNFMSTLARADAALQPTTLNVHRLLLTSTMLAAKFTDDRYYNNAFYAKVMRRAARLAPLRPWPAGARPSALCCRCSPPLPLPPGPPCAARPAALPPPDPPAQVGGISLAEVNRLEKEMLRLLDYKLYMSPEALVVAYRSLESGALIADGFLEQGQQQQGGGAAAGRASASCGKKRRSGGEGLAGEERPATRRTLCEGGDASGCDSMDTD
jgi:hypothetical protein